MWVREKKQGENL